MCSPRTARNFWLEQEVASLREKLESEALKSRPFQGSYWSRPFQTEVERARDDQEAVACMRRNAASGVSDALIGLRHHDDVHLPDRAGPGQAVSTSCFSGGAGPVQAHGDHGLLGRASAAYELGEHLGGNRARSCSVLADQCHGARASIQHPIGGAPHHGRALRQDRDVVEDGDLKAIPIQLPPLASPEGRDASLEAGDWLIQLEPLIGDLSKNAASWWRKVMEATTSTYAQWLHADTLSRLKIAAPECRALSSGFERLDQRVTSLLLQAVPKAIKDEAIATRGLSTTAILFRVMRTYQPGGLLEKSRLLEDLTTVPGVKTTQDVVAALRLWKRKASRASELCAQLPDPLVDGPNLGWHRQTRGGKFLSGKFSHCYVPHELQLGHQTITGQCVALF